MGNKGELTVMGRRVLAAMPVPGEIELHPSVLQTRAESEVVESSKASTGEVLSYRIPWPYKVSEVLHAWYASPWLAAIGKLLSRAVEGAEWELMPAVDSPNPEQKRDAEKWLKRPVVGQDGVSELALPQLLRVMALHYDQTGNIFVEVLRNRAFEPMRLSVIQPMHVWFNRVDRKNLYIPSLVQNDPIMGEYSFVPFGKREKGQLDAREYLHHRNPNSLSSFYGVPDWIEAADTVAVDNAHRRYLKGFFKNDAMPRSILIFTQDPEWTGPMPGQDEVAAAYNLAVDYMDANRGDMGGRHLVLQMPGGIKIDVVSLSGNEDPTFEGVTRGARDEILALRGISLIDLGLPEGGYRATAEEQTRVFRENVLTPFAQGPVSIINRVLMAEAPIGLGITDWRMALKFQRPEELLALIKAAQEAAGVPLIGRDSARKLIGLEPIGDDSVYTPAGMIAEYAGEEEA